MTKADFITDNLTQDTTLDPWTKFLEFENWFRLDSSVRKKSKYNFNENVIKISLPSKIPVNKLTTDLFQDIDKQLADIITDVRKIAWEIAYKRDELYKLVDQYWDPYRWSYSEISFELSIDPLAVMKEVWIKIKEIQIDVGDSEFSFWNQG